MPGNTVTEERLLCPESPNRRHHWRLTSEMHNGAFPAVCQYCLRAHRFGQDHAAQTDKFYAQRPVVFRGTVR